MSALRDHSADTTLTKVPTIIANPRKASNNGNKSGRRNSAPAVTEPSQSPLKDNDQHKISRKKKTSRNIIFNPKDLENITVQSGTLSSHLLVHDSNYINVAVKDKLFDSDARRGETDLKQFTRLDRRPVNTDKYVCDNGARDSFATSRLTDRSTGTFPDKEQSVNDDGVLYNGARPKTVVSDAPRRNKISIPKQPPVTSVTNGDKSDHSSRVDVLYSRVPKSTKDDRNSARTSSCQSDGMCGPSSSDVLTPTQGPVSVPAVVNSSLLRKRQEICNVDNDMNKQSSGVKSFEKVFSDIKTAAKEMMQELPEEKIAIFQSSLRHIAEKMFNHQDYQLQRLLGRSCFLEARIASQEKTIQKYQGLYEEHMKECEMLKSQISTDHSSERLPIAKSLEDMRKICVKNEDTLVKEMDLLQQDITQREEEIKQLKSCSNEDRNKWQLQIETKEEHIIILKKKKKILQNGLNTLNDTVEVLRRESALTTGLRSELSHQLEKEAQLEQEYDLVNMKEKTIQKYQGLYEELMKECAMLKSQISTDHSSELLPIAKSLEDMRKICVKNEETLVKEMDLLQQDITQREEEIKQLKSCSNEDRNKWQRQIETKEEHIIIVKKKKKILQNRLNTLNETVEVLRRESALTTGVRSEPSHQQELLIEKEELEQEYDETQKDLNIHEMLLSGHEDVEGRLLRDSPTTSGPSPLSPFKYKNIEDVLKRANNVSTEEFTQLRFAHAFKGTKHLDVGVSVLPQIGYRWEYPAEFVIKELWELKEFEKFIRAKFNELQKSSAKESQFDIVFMKCLNSFHNDLMGHLVVYSQDGMPPNFKYRDMFVNFENTMESICKVENVSQDFPVTICINAFRGYLDEFRNSASTRKKKAKSKKKQGRPKREKVKKDVIEHQGHKMAQVQFGIATYCELCSSIIWIMEKGYVCQVCKYTCHRKCLLKTTALCRGTQDSDLRIIGTKVFCVPLQSLVTAEEKIPAFLDLIIRLIEMHGMHTEDIYSKSGAAAKIKTLKMVLDSGAIDINVDEFPVHVLTSTLKTFFRELPEPLLTFDLYDEFIQASEIKDEREAIQVLFTLTQKLPKVNHDVLERLIFHLARVIQHEPSNKMSANGIAIIFAPCLLRTNKAVQAQELLKQINKRGLCIEKILNEQVRKYRETLQDIKIIDQAKTTAEERLTKVRQSIRATQSKINLKSKKDVESQPLEEDPESLEEQERVINSHIKSLRKEKEELTSGLPMFEYRHSSDDDIDDIDSTEDADLQSNDSPFDGPAKAPASLNKTVCDGTQLSSATPISQITSQRRVSEGDVIELSDLSSLDLNQGQVQSPASGMLMSALSDRDLAQAKKYVYVEEEHCDSDTGHMEQLKDMPAAYTVSTDELHCI